ACVLLQQNYRPSPVRAEPVEALSCLNAPPSEKGSPSTSSGRAVVKSALVLVDIVDRVLDGRDLLGSIVGNFDVEFFLERHDELDDVEAVGAQIIDETRFLCHLVGFDPEMLDDDLLHPFSSIAHWGLSFPFCVCCCL